MLQFRILVADGDLFRRAWLVSTLEAMGVVVEQAFSGWHTLRLLAGSDPADLVIAGRLPAPGGLRTLALARARGIDVPFALLADAADPAVRRRARELEAAVLPRTLDAALLARFMRSALGAGSGERAGRV